VDSAYERLFREFGIDLRALAPEQAAARMRATSIHLELALALDHWAHLKREPRKPDPDWRARLMAVARLADPDPWRNRVRDALETRDARTLQQIAASPSVIDLPVQMLTLFCETLDQIVGSHAGEGVLRQAQRQYPDDFQINFQLAWVLDHRDNPQLEESIRFYTAALSLRPRGTVTRGLLAEHLHDLGRDSEAIAEYRKGFESDSDSTTVHNNLAWILATSRDPKLWNPPEAIRLSRRALALDPRDEDAWNTLGVALYRAGDWKAAIEALERSAASGADSFDWFFIAMARWQLGEREEARRMYRLAVDWMTKEKPKDEELQRFRAEAEGLINAATRSQ
jgi:tetratricopeptide (TPR) repeat protein